MQFIHFKIFANTTTIIHSLYRIGKKMKKKLSLYTTRQYDKTQLAVYAAIIKTKLNS